MFFSFCVGYTLGLLLYFLLFFLEEKWGFLFGWLCRTGLDWIGWLFFVEGLGIDVILSLLALFCFCLYSVGLGGTRVCDPGRVDRFLGLWMDVCGYLSFFLSFLSIFLVAHHSF